MKHINFDKDDAENGKMIETKNARNGGYLVGRSHKNGGIKGVNVDTGEPIEVEGGEVVITKPAVDSKKYYTLNGKKMKPKEILSKLNSDHGGVAFAKGGKVGGDKYLLGGVSDEKVKEYFDNRVSNNGFVIRNTNDDLDSDLYRVLGSKKLANDVYVLKLKNLVNNGEWENDFIDSLTVGDIFYIKGMRKDSSMAKHLQASNPNVNFDFAEVPFILKDIFSPDDKKIGILYFERTYTDENGNEINEELSWKAGTHEFHNDDVVAVPKINNEVVASYLPDGEYNDLLINSQDFLNGKFLLRKDEMHIGAFGIGQYGDDSIKFAAKRMYNGYYGNHKRANNFDNYEIGDYDEYLVAVGDTWEIAHSQNDYLGQISFNQDNLRKQKLIEDGIYVIPYTVDEESAENEVLFYSGESELTTPKVTFVGRRTKFFETGRSSDHMTQVVKVIGLVLTGEPLERLQICNYILVENPDTKEKLIVKYPKFIRPIKMVTAENYGQPIIELSDEQKAVNKVKKKDVRDAQLYEILLEGLSQEETKLIVMKGLISSTDKVKNLNIDRRLNEIAVLKAQYKLDGQTALNLLDQFETMYYAQKSSRENKSGDVAINGQPSELTPTQYERVRSPEFIDWFGDWMTAYELGDYTGVSKVINPRTAEPIVLFHGTDADFTAWKFNEFPAAYFGDNRSYSEWFANLKSQGGEGHMYECFINIKNPIDMRQYGLDNYRMGEILTYLQETYGLKPTDIVPELKNLNEEQYQQVMNVNLKAWQFVRRGIPFLNFVKENTFYDGILMFEDNGQDIITTIVDGESVEVPNTTGSFVVFREGQIKWAGATYFNSIISDNRFAKGGKIKSLAKKYKEMDFVF